MHNNNEIMSFNNILSFWINKSIRLYNQCQYSARTCHKCYSWCQFYSRRGTRATRWGVTVLLHAPFHTAFYSTSSSSLFDFWILMTSSSILKCGHTAYISFSNIGHCKSWIFTGIKPASHWRGKLGTNWEDWKEVKTWSRICGL